LSEITGQDAVRSDALQWLLLLANIQGTRAARGE
jgi:hypothetical protein